MAGVEDRRAPSCAVAVDRYLQDRLAECHGVVQGWGGGINLGRETGEGALYTLRLRNAQGEPNDSLEGEEDAPKRRASRHLTLVGR